MKTLWLDTETTGLFAFKHDIIQLSGMVDIDGAIVKEFDFRVRPVNMETVEQKALDVNGIKKEDLYDFPLASVQIKELLKILDEYCRGEKFILAGYNTYFDMDFLKNFFKKTGATRFNSYFEYKCFDVYTLVFMLIKEGKIPPLENMKLVTLCEHFCIPLNAHDSMNDIRATRELYSKLVERHIK